VSPRETARERGRRLVSEGRLVLRRVDGLGVLGFVRGDSGEVHRVSYTPGHGWRCCSPARTQCAHENAAQLVTIAPDTEGWIDLESAMPRVADADLNDLERRRASVVKDTAARDEVTA
jgi:hypothetical protein